jgi:hypothetical protein
MRAFVVVAVLVGCSSSESSPISSGSPPAGSDAATSESDSSPPRDDAGNPIRADAGGPDGSSTAAGIPPFGGSSHGSGGAAPVDGASAQASGVTYRLIVPDAPKTPAPFLLVYSGTEGGATMTQNLVSLAQVTNTRDFIRAVLDGVQYNGDGNAGATVLDDVRAKYDVDKDRTYLISESAGTTAGFQLGFHLRESYFAAYWANDVTTSDGPATTAGQLGFAPWGQAGPGGNLAAAQDIVAKMQTAGYRVPTPAPYDGPGAGTHGDPNQFIAALKWLPGKSRK